MSTSLASKPLTIAQRPAAAGQRAAAHMHADDEKRVLAALAEIAVEELERNPSFALRVRGRYDELAPKTVRRQAAPKASQAAKPPKQRKTLVPIKEIAGHEVNIARKLDPYFLVEVYGAHQLRDALDGQPATNLREAVAIVKERNPGTRPSGASLQAMTDYIVQFVIGH
jgi:hypothetical protein